jgi:hypothetical protein
MHFKVLLAEADPSKVFCVALDAPLNSRSFDLFFDQLAPPLSLEQADANWRNASSADIGDAEELPAFDFDVEMAHDDFVDDPQSVEPMPIEAPGHDFFGHEAPDVMQYPVMPPDAADAAAGAAGHSSKTYDKMFFQLQSLEPWRMPVPDGAVKITNTKAMAVTMQPQAEHSDDLDGNTFRIQLLAKESDIEKRIIMIHPFTFSVAEWKSLCCYNVGLELFHDFGEKIPQHFETAMGQMMEGLLATGSSKGTPFCVDVDDPKMDHQVQVQVLHFLRDRGIVECDGVGVGSSSSDGWWVLTEKGKSNLRTLDGLTHAGDLLQGPQILKTDVSEMSMYALLYLLEADGWVCECHSKDADREIEKIKRSSMVYDGTMGKSWYIKDLHHIIDRET